MAWNVPPHGNARVVDQNIGCAMGCCNLARQGRHGVRVGYVEIMARHADAGAEHGDRLAQACRVDVCQREMAAPCGQGTRDGTPDPARRASDDGGFAADAHCSTHACLAAVRMVGTD